MAGTTPCSFTPMFGAASPIWLVRGGVVVPSGGVALPSDLGYESPAVVDIPARLWCEPAIAGQIHHFHHNFQ